MKKKNANKLSPGLYEIYWKRGGSSLAAIGNTEVGEKWFSPACWISESLCDWGEVSRVEEIKRYTDHQVKHQILHWMLDELVADFVLHTHRVPGYTSIMHLLQWSASEIKNPSEAEEVK